MKFHPDVLAAHAQFGGDLESMQKLYDLPDAIAAKDREIADTRQRTIEECAKVADEAEVELFEYPSELAGEYYRSGGVDASVGIAAAIRSLGKEGSGEQ